MAAPIVGSWGFLGVAAEFWFRCSLISPWMQMSSFVSWDRSRFNQSCRDDPGSLLLATSLVRRFGGF